MLDLIDRLEFIRAIELKPASANGISPLLLRQLAGRGARHTLQHCQRKVEMSYSLQSRNVRF
jgi:hypothetical protein